MWFSFKLSPMAWAGFLDGLSKDLEKSLIFFLQSNYFETRSLGALRVLLDVKLYHHPPLQYTASHSRSRKLGMVFFISLPVPKSWELHFSFPFPEFGNAIFHSHSHYREWIIKVKNKNGNGVQKLGIRGL